MTASRTIRLFDSEAARHERARAALALLRIDPQRLRVLRRLLALAPLTGSERLAVVCSCEPAAGEERIHALLDLGSDRPRRHLPPGPRILLGGRRPDVWWLALDPPRGTGARTLPGIEGRAKGLLALLRRPTSSPEVVGWADHPTPRRHVLRIVEALGRTSFQVRSEVCRVAVRGVRLSEASAAERPLLGAVLGVLGDLPTLASALFELGTHLEFNGHPKDAVASYRLGYEAAVALSDLALGSDASRFLGRAYRSTSDWTESARWYDQGMHLADVAGDLPRLAYAMDGLGNLHRERGAIPRARELYRQVLLLGRSAGDREAVADAHHSLMVLERDAGRLAEGVRHGWEAVSRHGPENAKYYRALLDLGYTLGEGGRIDAAEQALSMVAERSPELNTRTAARGARAYLAARRRDEDLYRRRLVAVEDGGAAQASVHVRGQLLHWRGKGLVLLGQLDEARAAFSAAASFAREHELHRIALEAERDAVELDAAPLPDPIGPIPGVEEGLTRLSRSVL